MNYSNYQTRRVAFRFLIILGVSVVLVVIMAKFNVAKLFNDVFITSPQTQNNPFQKTNTSTTQSQTKKIEVADLSQEQIKVYAKTNSCYLPLVKDSSLYAPGGKVGYSWEELFNDLLPEDNPYRNRYIVGDFMVLDEKDEPRLLEEVNPKLDLLFDFKQYDNTFFKLMDLAENGSKETNEFHTYVSIHHAKDSLSIMNFYNKVWKYKTPPLKRSFTRLGNNVYAAGQRVCFCEAKKDTLLLIAQFGTSAKSFTPIIGRDSMGREFTKGMALALPIGNNRPYYGSLYRITSKNWETERRYEELDVLHDAKLGGGNQRITFFKSRAELPNFLLMTPTKEFPHAMPQNGLHEVALRELSRGMLGTANSIGCIRLSDFGSKFSRWWVPQNSKFFILYDETRYHKVLPLDQIKEDLPFKTLAEGNAFRRWLIQTYPLKAKQLEIDPSGQHDNGFILDAYYLYGEIYEDYKLIQKTM